MKTSQLLSIIKILCLIFLPFIVWWDGLYYWTYGNALLVLYGLVYVPISLLLIKNMLKEDKDHVLSRAVLYLYFLVAPFIVAYAFLILSIYMVGDRLWGFLGFCAFIGLLILWLPIEKLRKVKSASSSLLTWKKLFKEIALFASFCLSCIFAFCAAIAFTIYIHKPNMRYLVPKDMPVEEQIYAKSRFRDSSAVNIFTVAPHFEILNEEGREGEEGVWQQTPISPKLHQHSKAHVTLFMALRCLNQKSIYSEIYKKEVKGNRSYFQETGNVIKLYVPEHKLLYIASYD